MQQLVTAYEASRMLRCRYSSLMRMVANGLLRSAPLGVYKKSNPNSRAKYVFYLSDVEELKKKRSEKKRLAGPNVHEQLEGMQLRIDQLEQTLHQVAASSGMVPIDLPTDKQGIHMLFITAQNAAEKVLSDEEISRWGRRLLFMDGAYFMRCRRYVVGSPWQLFTRLGEHLANQAMASGSYFMMPMLKKAQASLRVATAEYEVLRAGGAPPVKGVDDLVVKAMLSFNPGLLVRRSPHQTSDGAAPPPSTPSEA